MNEREKPRSNQARVETQRFQPIPYHVQRDFLKEKNPGVHTSTTERTREFTQTRHADR